MGFLITHIFSKNAVLNNYMPIFQTFLYLQESKSVTFSYSSTILSLGCQKNREIGYIVPTLNRDSKTHPKSLQKGSGQLKPFQPFIIYAVMCGSSLPV